MRTVSRTVPAPAGLHGELVGVPVGSDLVLDLRLESVSEGVLVSGAVQVTLAGECARCLDPLTEDLEVAIQQLFVYPGREVEEVSLTLPPGRHLMRMPKDVSVAFDAASYHSTWTLQGDTLTHRAELVSRIGDVLCAGDLRHAAATALEAIRHVQRTHVALSDE